MEHQTRELQPATLHELAREYFGAAFPNPDRHACPDRADLLAQAQTGRLPDDALRAHLFGCSECFTAYRTALALRPATVPAQSWRMGWPAKLRAALTLKPGLAWAGGVALLLAFALLPLVLRMLPRWRSVNPRTLDRAQTQPPTHPAPPVLAQSPNHTPLRPAAHTEPDATVRVDLNEYVALRDAAEARKTALTLRPVRTRLQLRLPEGSLAGVYTVSLVDASDRAVATATAVSRDGARLLVALDLRGVRVKNYWLQLQHPAEPPALYPVRVVGRND